MLEVALGKGFFTEQDIVHYYVEIGKAVKNRRDQLGLYLAPGD